MTSACRRIELLDREPGDDLWLGPIVIEQLEVILLKGANGVSTPVSDHNRDLNQTG